MCHLSSFFLPCFAGHGAGARTSHSPPPPLLRRCRIRTLSSPPGSRLSRSRIYYSIFFFFSSFLPLQNHQGRDRQASLAGKIRGAIRLRPHPRLLFPGHVNDTLDRSRSDRRTCRRHPFLFLRPGGRSPKSGGDAAVEALHPLSPSFPPLCFR